MFPLVLIRYQTYADPCNLLFPPWVSVVVSGPFYLLLVACPCWHLATTLERVYATYQANIYEKTLASYGIWSSVVVWLVSLSYAAYIVCLALMDEGFRKPKAAVGLTTKTNANFALKTHYITLVADLLTCFADLFVLRWNLRKLNSVFPSYSLSRSYQTNENVIVTTRLVLPMSFSNTTFYVLFLSAASWTRHVYRNVLNDPTPSPLLYGRVVCASEWISTCLQLQMLVSVLIFLWFSKRQPKKVSIAKKSEEYELYVRHLRQHW